MVRVRGNPNFLLSGFVMANLEIERLRRDVSKLGGGLLLSEGFVSSCTHLICFKPSRSEKFLAACASGLWILIPRYLEDCIAANCWLPEEDYEWSERFSKTHSPLMPNCFYTSPRRNRLTVETTKKGRFADWIVIVILEEAEKKAVYERLLASGGASLVVNFPSVLKGRLLKQVTHILAENTSIDKLLFALQEGVPCISPAYLRSHLILDNCPNWKFFNVTTYSVDKDPLLQAIERQSSRPIRSARFGRVLDNCLCTDHVLGCHTKRENILDCLSQKKPELTNKTRGRKRALSDQDVQKSTTKQLAKQSKLSVKVVCKKVPAQRVGPMDRFLVKNPPGSANIVAVGDVDEPMSEALPMKFIESAPKSYCTRSATLAGLNASTTTDISVTSSELLKTIVAVPLRATDEAPSRRGRPICGRNALTKLNVHASLTACVAQSAVADSAQAGPRKNVETHVPRSIIADAINEFLSADDTEEKHKSILIDSNEIVPVTPSAKKMPQTACEEMTHLSVTIFDNYCKYSEFELIALQYLWKMGVTKKCYPPVKTVAHVLWTMLRNCSKRSDAIFAHRFLKTLLTVHPPSATGFQLYYQKIICSNINGRGSWDFFDGWDNIMTLLTFSENDFETTDTEKLGNHLALGFIIDVLCDDHEFASRSFRADSCSKTAFSSLVTRLVWPSSKVGSVNRSTEKLVKFCIHLNNRVAVNNLHVESQKSSFRLLHLLAECCRIDDPRQSTVAPSAHFTLGLSAEKFALAVSKEIIDGGDESSSVSQWLRMVRPRWLQLKVSKLLLDHFTGSIRMHNQSASLCPVSFRLITNSLFVKPAAEPSPDKVKTAYRSRTSKSDAIRASHTSGSPVIKPEQVNKKNFKGETPLMLACMKNNVQRVRQLLSIPDVDVNAQDNAGWSALHEACNHGHVECIEELIAYKAKKTIRGYFIKGSGRGQDKKNLNLLVATPDGITPLHDAVMNNRIDVVRTLLNRGGSHLLEAKTIAGKTPVDCTDWPEMKKVLEKFRNQTSHISEHTNDIIMEEVQTDGGMFSADSIFLGNAVMVNSCDYKTCLVLSLHCVTGYMFETNLDKLLAMIGRRLTSTSESKYSMVHQDNVRRSDFTDQLTDDVEYLFGVSKFLGDIDCEADQNEISKRWLNRIRLLCNFV